MKINTEEDTIIEIYDPDILINNVMSQVIYPEAQMIFVGFKDELTSKETERIADFFKMRQAAYEPEFCIIPEEKVESAVASLRAIMDRKHLYFEVCGGSGLILLAVGILYTEYRFSMFRINSGNAEPELIEGRLPQSAEHKTDLKYAEILELTGGVIGASSEDASVKITPELEEIVNALWERFRKDPSGYNRDSSRFAELINRTRCQEDGDNVYIDDTGLTRIEREYEWCRDYAMLLDKEGVIEIAEFDRKSVRFKYRNNAAKDLIKKSGLLLELFARISAVRSGIFSDVRQGIRLDWDGCINENGTVTGTNNEVDLVLVKGFQIYFVSCKTGAFDRQTLYELETVTDRFSVGNSHMVMICDSVDDATQERAGDMGIALISDVCELKGMGELSGKYIDLDQAYRSMTEKEADYGK